MKTSNIAAVQHYANEGKNCFNRALHSKKEKIGNGSVNRTKQKIPIESGQQHKRKNSKFKNKNSH